MPSSSIFIHMFLNFFIILVYNYAIFSKFNIYTVRTKIITLPTLNVYFIRALFTILTVEIICFVFTNYMYFQFLAPRRNNITDVISIGKAITSLPIIINTQDTYNPTTPIKNIKSLSFIHFNRIIPFV